MRLPPGFSWRRVSEWLALTNAAGLLVWLGVFMNWVQFAFGAFDPDLIGGSTFVWPFLIVASSALVLFGSGHRWLSWAAWAPVALMAATLVDQTAGALRDGDVSAYGLRLGVLMGAELLIAAGAAFAGEQARPATT